MDTVKILLLILVLSMTQVAKAGGLALRFGPAGLGSGGTNPLSLPPSGADVGLSYVTDKKLEFNGSITGLTLARRDMSKWGGYVSLGGGLIFNANGIGFGPYAAFGYERGCLSWLGCFSIEMSQALGVGSGTLVSPYAVRIGVIRWF
jgi:hypothetical protein